MLCIAIFLKFKDITVNAKCNETRELSQKLKRKTLGKISFVKGVDGGFYKYTLKPYNKFPGYFWIGSNTYPKIKGHNFPLLTYVDKESELFSEVSVSGKGVFITQNSFANISNLNIKNLNVNYPIDNARIVQIAGVTHNINQLGDYSNAIDFEASLGSNIRSISDGVVVHVEDRYPDNGCYSADLVNEANQIIILSDIGYEVIYGHLKQHSSMVSEGAIVSKNQLIAEVGNSGFSGKPHLHLHTGGLTVNGYQTLPFKFSCAKQDRYKTPVVGKYSCKL